MTIAIRPAGPGDEAAILAMIRALAVYENEPDAVETSEADLTAALFARDAIVHAHLALLDGAIVGFALWYRTFSTWTGRPGLYLEDLFVEERARGRGIGRALFAALAAEARRLGCARFEWEVLDWNEPARLFYQAIGGRQQAGWEPWRLDGPALDRLADEAPPAA